MDIHDVFSMGMKRDIPKLIEVKRARPVFNLGAGNTMVPGAINLDLPKWDATTDMIPCEDEGAGGIYAFHFFEHLDNEQAIAMLRECQRVLAPGAPLTLVVPHHYGTMAYQDLTHKTFYNTDTFSNLFNKYFQSTHREGWKFTIGLNIVIGITERNLALMTQLIKES